MRLGSVAVTFAAVAVAVATSAVTTAVTNVLPATAASVAVAAMTAVVIAVMTVTGSSSVAAAAVVVARREGHSGRRVAQNVPPVCVPCTAKDAKIIIMKKETSAAAAAIAVKDVELLEADYKAAGHRGCQGRRDCVEGQTNRYDV